MKRIVQGGIGTVVLLAGAMGAMAAQGALRVYYANDPVGRNVVSIESRAPLETMLTRTNAVTGEIKGNPANILDNPQARFEIDLTTLDTGIGMRNEHMKSDKWLDTAKYPKAVFTLNKVSRAVEAGALTAATDAALHSGQLAKIAAEGTLEMHGMTRPVTAKIELIPMTASADTAKRLPGDLLHVRATFPLKLDQFGIAMDAATAMKVANEQQVTVDIFTSTQLPQPR
jgi:polyisoprenoid-binding protein YceI